MDVSSGRERTETGQPGATASAPLVPRDERRRYAAAGFLIGLVNLVLMMTLLEPASLARLTFLLLALLTLTAVPMRPLTGAVAYLVLWVVLLRFPGPYADDVAITHAALFFFLGRFLPLRAALCLGAAVPLATVVLATPPTVVLYLFLLACTLPPGALLRRRESTLRQEISAGEERLEAVRAEVAREMHDLVAYSMSQTVLRARSAAADPSYPEDVRQELHAISATAADALHELRLVLRVLRRTQAGSTLEDPSATSQTVVVGLDAALQAVADDLSASGFSVTLRSTDEGECPRLQAVTLSRVAREMGSNIMRHGTTDQSVTITLAKETNQVCLVMTNGTSPNPAHDLPTSGTGLLGMRERLAAVDGSLSTREEDGSWTASAVVPLEPPPALSPEIPP
ncbi:sensor histidine kinase [Actinomyces lilanjuaniae]|nr:histidine kinase [Actinomyces lilanjuaniae]